MISASRSRSSTTTDTMRTSFPSSTTSIRTKAVHTSKVCTAFVRIDVVDEGKDVLIVSVVVLERDLDADIIVGGIDVDDLGMQRLGARVEILHHLLKSATRQEQLGLFLAFTLVRESDADALVEIREFAHAIRKRIVLEGEVGEYQLVGPEPCSGSGFVPGDCPHDLELGYRRTAIEIHVVDLAIALYPHLELR